MDEIEKFETIVSDFLKIPHNNIEPTFLEICRFPQSRFEEVCSRILAFYLNPNAEHGMNDLWLSALLKVAGKSDWCDYRHNIKINTEEYANGKRIDITIISEDYVIAIENKITAGLYNPLDVYKNYISNTYPNKKQLLIVLSIKHLMTANDFQRCSYQDLFNEVNSHIGDYMTGANQKYLTYLVEFMKTINNMDNSNSQREKQFFSENKTDIDELIKRYEQYKENIKKDQSDKISTLHAMLNELTDGKWWTYPKGGGNLLGVTFNEKSNRIGIEAHFEEKGGNPCDSFRACITTWNKTEWLPYEDAVLKEFSNNINKVQDSLTGAFKNRVYIWLYKKDNGDMETIANDLKEIYNRLSTIASIIH